MSESKKVYPVCFWCGTVINEPIELGDEFTQEQKDAIPNECVLHYDPCPGCMSEWTSGRVFIEYDAVPAYDDQPALEDPNGAKMYPTGRTAVIALEKALALFGQGSSDGDVEPISFLSKENFAASFEREPEITCFWCGEPVSGIKSAEKHLKVTLDYEPCAACKKKYNDVSLLFECDYASDRAIKGVSVQVDGKTLYPTGRLMRLEYKEAARLLGPDTGDFVYVIADKFKILSGEIKQKSVNDSSKPKTRTGLLARNDGN